MSQLTCCFHYGGGKTYIQELNLANSLIEFPFLLEPQTNDKKIMCGLCMVGGAVGKQQLD
jgi:hypothetical protein